MSTLFSAPRKTVSTVMMMLLAIASLTGVLMTVTAPTARADTSGGDTGSGGGGGGAVGGDNCPGCTSGGGGGFGGGWASTYGAGSFKSWTDRTALYKENRSYPEPLGTYNNLIVQTPAWGVYWTAGDIHKLNYLGAKEPCRQPTRYAITTGAYHGSAAQPSTISKNPNGEFANNAVGVHWFEKRLWNAGATQLLRTETDFGACIRPPEPTVSWVDCPISISDLALYGPYGTLPTADRKGINVDLKTLTADKSNTLTYVPNDPGANSVSHTWWYSRGTKPIDIGNKTWGEIMEMPEFKNNPGKRFSALMRAWQTGRIGRVPWVEALLQKTIWDTMIAPCAQQGMYFRSNNPINTQEREKFGPNQEINLAGNYQYKSNITYVRCEMVNYPPMTAEISNSGIGTGVSPATHLETWGWEYRVRPGTFYGCQPPKTLTNSFAQGVTAFCNSTNIDITPTYAYITPVGSLTGSWGTTWTALASRNYNALYWANGCPPPSTPPPSTPPPTPDPECTGPCETPTSDPTCEQQNNGPCEETIETAAFCEYDPGTTDASILTADNATPQKNETTVIADGGEVKVSWPQAKPMFKDPKNDSRTLTNAEVATTIKDVTTTYTYNAGDGYIDRNSGAVPVSSTPKLGVETPITTNSTPTVSYRFYKGTNLGTAITVEQQTKFSYKTTVTKNTIVFDNNGLHVEKGTPVETWKTDGACPALTAKITPTQVRNGN